MPIDFPNTPTTGATYTSGNRTWQYDGAKWVPASTSPSGFVLEAPTDGQNYERQNSVWVPGVGFAQGYTNKIRNGTFDVWQRGSVTVNAAAAPYTADGWLVSPSGASVTVSRMVTSTIPPPGASAMQIIGTAGVTTVTTAQRIESYVAAFLAGQRVTFQCWAYCTIAQTPQLAVYYTNSLDNFSAITAILSPTNLQPLVVNTWTQVAYTLDLPVAVTYNGLQVNLNFPGSLGTGSIYMAAADLRATPGLAVGLQASPPPPELRPVHEELLFCYRYFETGYDNGVAPGTINSAAALQFYLTNLPSATYNAAMVATFKAAKRATPTLTLYSPITGAAAKVRNIQGNLDLNANVSNTGTTSFSIYNVAAAAAATTVNLGACWAASAEL